MVSPMNDNCKKCKTYLACIVGEFHTLFDYIGEDESGSWAYICSEHAKCVGTKIWISPTDLVASCGMNGCDNKASHCVEFRYS